MNTDISMTQEQSNKPNNLYIPKKTANRELLKDLPVQQKPRRQNDFKTPKPIPKRSDNQNWRQVHKLQPTPDQTTDWIKKKHIL